MGPHRTVFTCRQRLLTVLSIASLAALAFMGVAAAGADRALPPKYLKSPYSLMSLSVGHPNGGWQARAKKLDDSPVLTVRAKSRRANYGHPALVLMLGRSARDIGKAAPGSVMLVGDLSLKHGGQIAGHRSHQSGRDADVAFYATDGRGRPAKLDRFVAFGSDGKAKDGSGLSFDDARNWMLVQSWARDTRAGLSHIFVAQPLKARLVRFAQRHERFAKYLPRALELLKQAEHGEAHDDHFHVRISCPESQIDLCREESR